MNNIYCTMILPTPRQMIDKLSKFDGIVLGKIDNNKVEGISNDFYTQQILDVVREDIPELHYAYKSTCKNRTLWLITTKNLDVFPKELDC